MHSKTKSATAAALFGLVLVAAAWPGTAAGDPPKQPGEARVESRSRFDLDLAALYRSAAAQGAPAMMWQTDASNGCGALPGFSAPLAYGSADCRAPASTGHVLDLPQTER